MEKGKSNQKLKFGLIVVSVLIAIGVSFMLGNSFAKVELEEEKVNYEQIVGKVNDKQKELQSLENDLAIMENEYKEKELEYNEALEVLKKAIL